MKLTLKTLIILLAISFATDLMAQNRLINTNHFGSYNYVDSYDETINSIGLILNTNDSQVISDAKNEIKQLYQNMSGTSITDADLDVMMDFTTANYDTWMAVLQDSSNGSSQNSSGGYLIRSLIMNLKTRI